MTDKDKSAVKEFKEVVNMTPKKLEKWLDTKESKKVGFKETDRGESVGHQSGEQIIEILDKNQSDYSDGDLKHIHKVVGYIKRHLAQKPDGDITETNWRYSLMNWGHDPK